MDIVIVARDTAQAEATPAMTNLEAQRRCQAYFQDNADYWLADGKPERAAFWTKLAQSCQVDIDGIIASGDDNWIGF